MLNQQNNSEKYEKLLENGELNRFYSLINEEFKTHDTVENILVLLDHLLITPWRNHDKRQVRRFFLLCEEVFSESLEILERRYNFEKSVRDVVEQIAVIKRWSELSTDSDIKAALLLEAADLYNGLENQRHNVMLCLSQALQWAPASVEVLKRLADLSLKQGLFERVTECYHKEAFIYTESQIEERSELFARVLKFTELLLDLPPMHSLTLKLCDLLNTLDPEKSSNQSIARDLANYPENWSFRIRRLKEDALDTRSKEEASFKYLSIAQILYSFSPENLDEIQQNLEKCFLLKPGHRIALKFYEKLYQESEQLNLFIKWLHSHVKSIRKLETAKDCYRYLILLKAQTGASLEDRIQILKEAIELDQNEEHFIHILAELYIEHDQIEKGLEVIEDYLDHCVESVKRRHNLKYAAKISRNELSDMQRTALYLEEYLEEYASIEVHKELISIYRDLNNKNALVAHLETILQLLNSNNSLYLEYLIEINDLLVKMGQEDRKTLKYLGLLYVIEPSKDDELRLRNIAEKMSLERDLIDIYLEQANMLNSNQEQTETRIKAVKLALILDDADLARRTLEEILKVDESHSEAQALMETLLLQEGNSEEVLELLERKYQQSVEMNDIEKQINILLRLSNGYVNENNLEWAIDRLEKIIKLDNSRLEIYQQILHFNKKTGKTETEIDTLKSLILYLESRPLDENEELLFRTYKQIISKYQAGTDTDLLIQQILSFNNIFGAHSEVIRLIENSLSNGIYSHELMRILIDYYSENAQWDKVDHLLTQCSFNTESEVEKSKLVRQRIDILEYKLHHYTEALSLQAKEVSKNAEVSDEDLNRLSNIAEKGDLNEDFLEIISFLDEDCVNDIQKQKYAQMRIRLIAKVGGDTEKEIEAYEQLLSFNKNELSVIHHLTQLYQNASQWTKLYHLLEHHFSLREAQIEGFEHDTSSAYIAKRIVLLAREYLTGNFHAEALKEYLSFCLYSEHQLPLKQQKEPALIFIQLLNQCDSPDLSSLSQVIRKMSDISTGEDKVIYRLEESEFLINNFTNESKAVERALYNYQKVFEENPTLIDLEEGVNGFFNHQEISVELRKESGQLLMRFYEATQNIEKVVTTIEHVILLEDDPEKKRNLVEQKIAYMQEAKLNPENLFDELVTFLELDPCNQEIRQKVEAIALSSGKTRELFDFYEELFPSIQNEKDETKIEYLQLIIKHAGTLSLYNKSIEYLRILIGYKSGYIELWESLKSYYETIENHVGVAECLEEMIALSTGEIRKIRLLTLSDYYFEQLDITDKGFETLELCYQENSNNLMIASKLIAVYQKFENNEKLPALLRNTILMSADLEHDRGRYYQMHLDLARLLLSQPGGHDEVLELLKICLNQKIDDEISNKSAELLTTLIDDERLSEFSIRMLNEFYTNEHMWIPLVELLRLAASKSDDNFLKAEIYDRIAACQEHKMMQADQAFISNYQALKTEISQPRLKKCKQLAIQTDNLSELPEILEEIADVLTEEDETYLIFWREILALGAELNRGDLQEKAAQKILNVRENDLESLQVLETISREKKDELSLQKVLERKLEFGENTSEILMGKKELAEIYVRNNSLEKAEVLYLELYDLEHEDSFYHALDRIYTETGDTAAHAKLLNHRFELLSDLSEKAHIKARLALMYLFRRGDPVSALSSLSEAVQLEPKSDEVLHSSQVILEYSKENGLPPLKDCLKTHYELLFERSDYIALSDTLEFELSRSDQIDDQLRIIIRLAKLHELECHDLNRSFQYYCRALQLSPKDFDVRDNIERLAHATQSEHLLTSIYEDVVEDVKESSIKVDYYIKMADLEESVSSPEEAFNYKLLAIEYGCEDENIYYACFKYFKGNEESSSKYLSFLNKYEEFAEKYLESSFTAQLNYEKTLIYEQQGNSNDALLTIEKAYSKDGANALIASKYVEYLKLFSKMDDLERYYSGLILEESTVSEVIYVDKCKLIAKKCDTDDHFISLFNAHKEYLYAFPQSEQMIEHSLEILNMFEGKYAEFQVELIRLLLPLCIENQSWNQVVVLLDREISHASQWLEKKNFLMKKAEVLENKQSSPELAYMVYVKSLRMAPSDIDVQNEFERLSQKNEDFDTLIALYEDISDSASITQEVKCDYLEKLAYFYEEKFDDFEEACSKYTDLYELSENIEQRGNANRHLERLFRRLEKPDNLAQVLHQKVSLLTENDQNSSVISTLIEAGHIEKALGANTDAIRSFRSVLNIDPENLGVLKEIQDLLLKEEMYSELDNYYRSELEIVNNSDQQRYIELLFLIGELSAEHLKDKETALWCFEKIYSLEPTHQKSVRYLSGILGKSESFDWILLSFYRSLSMWQECVEVYEVRLLDVERKNEVDNIINYSLEISKLKEENLELPEAAFMKLANVLNWVPDNDIIHLELHRLADKCTHWEVLCDIYEETADSSLIQGKSNLCLDLRKKAALICEKELVDFERAIELYEGSLNIQNSGKEILEALSLLYPKVEAWDKYHRILQRRLLVCETNSEKIRIMFASATNSSKHLEQPEDAILVLRNILDYESDHRPAKQMLIELLRVDGEANERIILLESELEIAAGNSENEYYEKVKVELARLTSESENHLERSIILWEELENVSGLERNERFEELNSLYHSSERWDDLKDLYIQEVEQEKEPTRNATLQQELSQILAEYLGDCSQAIQRHLDVLKVDPSNRSSLASLRELYRQSKQDEELVNLLRKMLRLTNVVDEVKNIRFELSEVLVMNLDRKAEAAETAKYILELGLVEKNELEKLDKIFAASEAYVDLSKVLKMKLEKPLDSENEKEILLSLASIYREKLNLHEESSEYYLRLLQVDNHHIQAFEQLREIYEIEKKYRELLSVLEIKVSVYETSEEKIKLLLEMAQISEEYLGDKMYAFMAVSRAFHLDYSQTDIADRMDSLGESAEMVDAVVENYDDALAFVSEKNRIIAIHLRIAELNRKVLRNYEDSEEHLRKILEYDASNQDALSCLVLQYCELEQWTEAVLYLERQIDICEDEEVKIGFYEEICRIHLENLNDIDAAIESYKMVIEILPHDPYHLEVFSGLLERAQRWPYVLSVLEDLRQLADISKNSDSEEKWALKIAHIWEQEVENFEQAIKSLESVVKRQPEHEIALKGLERLYLQIDDTSALISVYERMLLMTSNESKRLSLYFKIASCSEDNLMDTHASIEAYKNIINEDDSNPEALENLARLYRLDENWPDLIHVLLEQNEFCRDEERRSQAYVEIAKIYAEEMHDSVKAEEYYLKSIEEDSQSIEAIHLLRELYEGRGDWFNALSKMYLEVKLEKDPLKKAQLYFEMGELNEKMLLDLAAAEQAHVEATQCFRGFTPSLHALQRISRHQKKWQSLISWLRIESETSSDIGIKVSNLTTVAEILRDEFSDLEQAALEFEKALEITYDHIPAAKSLSAIYFRNEEFEKAEKLFAIILEADKKDLTVEEEARCHYKYAYSLEKNSKSHQAISAYRQSFEIDSSSLTMLEAFATLLFNQENYSEASEVYSLIIHDHRENLSQAEVVDYYYQLALVLYKTEEYEKAQLNVRKALKSNHEHSYSLRLLADIHKVSKEYEECYESLSRLADVSEGDEKFGTLKEIANLSIKKLDDAYRAIDAYVEACRLDPSEKEIWSKLYDLYKESAQGQQAADALEQVISLEEDEKNRVRLTHLLGECYRDDLQADAKAVQYFNVALDLDPSHIHSFQAIESLLSQFKKWALLEENYMMMLKRLKKDDVHIREVLWKNLADLYKYKLKNLESAIKAYKIVCEVAPSKQGYKKSLAELLLKSNRIDEAILIYQDILSFVEDKASRIELLHTLVKLYLNRGMSERAYVACSILESYKALLEDEKKLFMFYTQNLKVKAQKPWPQNIWKDLLLHKDLSEPLMRLTNKLNLTIGSYLLSNPKNLGLDREKIWSVVDLDSPIPHYFVSQMRYVRDILGLKPLSLYIQKNSSTTLQALPLPQASLAVGDHSDVFGEVPQRILWFVCAKEISFLHPSLSLAVTMGYERFSALIYALIISVEPRFSPPAEIKFIEEYIQLVQKLGPKFLQQIKGEILEICKSKSKIDFEKFYMSIEKSVLQTAYFLCGDLAMSVRLVKDVDSRGSTLSYESRRQTIFDFAMSEAHFEFRELLDLQFMSKIG